MIKRKKYRCKICGEERLILREGICLLCLREPRGKIIKNNIQSKQGIEVKSKTGKKDENIWMARK